MSIRKILVPLSGDSGDTIALDAAAMLASRHNGEIEALHVRASGQAALPFIGDTVSGAVIEEIIDRIEDESEQRAKAAADSFAAWKDKASLPDGCEANYVQASGDRDGELAAHARCNDMIVMRSPSSEDDAGLAADIETVLLGSGRPLLLVPKKVSEGFATKVILAWNDSVESARAMAAAMPLIEGADAVTVAAVRVDADGTPDLNPVVHLARSHGAEANASIIDADGQEISDVLVQHTKRHAGALLVMGAYSHNRLKEQVLGGVTQDILDFTEVPVLLIH